ncbi:hypothetical protein ACF0H5_006414 [Mactra antiquata]
MATGSQDPVLSVLDDIGLRNLVDNFKKQKVTTLQTCKQLSDNELSHLGLTTIGDRARFRAEVQSYQPTTPTSQGESTSTLRTFLPSRSGNRFHRGKKDLRRKTWTANVMCLSDVNQTSVPSHSEKVCLQKASLGIKKISFDASGSESDVHDTLLNEFPKLSSSGGFELMYCAANKRELKKIDVKWDVPHLKTVLGGQSRVYVRPIQNSLSLDSDKDEDNATHTLEYSCQTCGSSFSVDELRSHIADCKTKNKTSREETFQEQEEDVITNDILEPHIDMNMPLLHASIDNTDLYFLETNLATADPGIVEWQTPRVSLEVAERPEDITKSCIDDLTNFQISDPIHALRYIRSKIVCGRKLEIEEQDLATGLTGDVNFIVVDRQNILTTGMEEIESLQNLRLTLDVQFYGETAQDYGGPRKEFFSLILPAIQEKYFDPIRNWVDVEEYKTVGKILDYESPSLHAASHDTCTRHAFYIENGDTFTETIILTRGIKSKIPRINRLPEVYQIPEGNSRW